VSNQAAAYLKINHGSAQTEFNEGSNVEVERIYVLNEFQHRNLGRMLMEHALDRARALDAEFLWLGVWEKNEKAMAFYRRLGLLPFGRHIFVLGDEAQWDIMMRHPAGSRFSP
jgi:ribosomal protein S18 acetylase RimI-like enzyme